MAERAVRGLGLKRSQREEKGRIDSTAAALILQTFLRMQADATGTGGATRERAGDDTLSGS
jgi:RNase H-fold protein (predicted Holliday junction resolvase)